MSGIIQIPLMQHDILYLKDIQEDKLINVPAIPLERVKEIFEAINYNIDHLEPRSPQPFSDMKELFKKIINEKLQI